MADEVIKVTGLPEVRKALYEYSRQLGDKVVISALRQGANHVRKAARQAAPKKTGLLTKSIIVANSKIYRAKGNADTIGVYLTIRKGRRVGGKKAKDAFYGRFLEDGWNVRGKTNTVGAFNRRGKFRFSRAVQTAYFGGKTGRKSLPGKRDIPGRLFIKGSFERTKYEAVQIIIQAAKAGAEIVKRRLGMN